MCICLLIIALLSPPKAYNTPEGWLDCSFNQYNQYVCIKS